MKIIHKMLPIKEVQTRGEQVREKFGKKEHTELMKSIKELGLIHAIIVIKNKTGSYDVVAGERRWRALKASGAKEIPVGIITKLEHPAQLLEIGLTENELRVQLTSEERENSVYTMWTKWGPKSKNPWYRSMADISKKMGKSRYWASELITAKMERDKIKEDVGPVPHLSSKTVRHMKKLDPETKKVIAKSTSKRKGEKKLTDPKTISILKKVKKPKAQTAMAKALKNKELDTEDVEEMADTVEDAEEVKSLVDAKKKKASEFKSTLQYIKKERAAGRHPVIKTIIKDPTNKWNAAVESFRGGVGTILLIRTESIKNMMPQYKKEIRKLAIKVRDKANEVIEITEEV